MKFVQTLAQASPATWSLKWHLHAALAKWEPGRDVANVHASDLDPGRPDFCARERILAQRHKIDPGGEYLSTSARLTFWMGRKLQEGILEEFVPERVIADWKCRTCGLVEEFCKRPRFCRKCNYPHFRALELRFVSPESGVGGGIDLVIDFGLPPYRACEIKTLAQDQFSELVAPLAEHRWRTNLYLRLIAEAAAGGDPRARQIATDHALILYVTKGTWGKKDPLPKQWGLRDGPWSPFKEYQVQRDDSATEKRLEQPRLLKLHRDEQRQELPERICGSSGCKRAQVCRAAKPCFWGEA